MTNNLFSKLKSKVGCSISALSVVQSLLVNDLMESGEYLTLSTTSAEMSEKLDGLTPFEFKLNPDKKIISITSSEDNTTTEIPFDSIYINWEKD